MNVSIDDAGDDLLAVVVDLEEADTHPRRSLCRLVLRPGKPPQCLRRYGIGAVVRDDETALLLREGGAEILRAR